MRTQRRFENETVWLAQALIAGLFEKDVRTIDEHLLHFAATGKTAAEFIAERADSAQPNMGLMTWRSGAVRKGDVTVAKNYLREEGIEELNGLVAMFLDFAEAQARRRKPSRWPLHPPPEIT